MKVEAGEARQQVERLLRSDPFAASTALQRLLEYLAERSLSGQADQLKEYTIGIEAFGKPESYDPREDSIVRHHVGRLRQKLVEYYQAEGGIDPVIVTLPKGHFRLTFEPNRPVESREVRKWRIVCLALAALLGMASLLLVYAWRPKSAAPAETSLWSGDLEVLWQPFLKSHRRLVVCVGTPLFVRFPGAGYYRRNTLNEWGDVRQSPEIANLWKTLGGPQPEPWYVFTGVGEAHAAFSLARLLGQRRSEVSLARSSAFAWDQIAADDVVFVGPPKYNRQLNEIPIEPEFVLDIRGIQNLHPHPGEPASFLGTQSPDNAADGEVHALISLTPGLSGRGAILVLAANSSPGTQAAAEWVTDRAHAAELVARLRQPNGSMPEAFQAVFKVRYKDLIPVASSCVAHRVLQKRPALKSK